MHVAKLSLCKELYELSGWNNDAGTIGANRLKVWMPSYHLAMMGKDDPAYHRCPPSERIRVEVSNDMDMHVEDDPRNRIPMPEDAFAWWCREMKKLEKRFIPAYDLGYLLRKLPNTVKRGSKELRFVFTNSTTDESWVADYLVPLWQQGLPERGMDVWLHYGNRAKLTEASIPEDALCKLAIELFKQGVLKPGEK